MKAQLVYDCQAGPSAPKKKQREGYQAGEVIVHEHAYRLVQMGVARPADDKCAEACGMTTEQIEAAIAAQRKVRLGIHPDDYEAFDRGEMVGYNPDGTHIPGPNAPPEEYDGPLIIKG